MSSNFLNYVLFLTRPHFTWNNCLCISVTPEFVLAGIHVKPSEAIKEITALETVQGDVISKMENENILFLGDMNAECSYAPKYKLNVIPIRVSTQYHWLIGDDVDTTVSKGTDCAYDR